MDGAVLRDRPLQVIRFPKCKRCFCADIALHAGLIPLCTEPTAILGALLGTFWVSAAVCDPDPLRPLARRRDDQILDQVAVSSCNLDSGFWFMYHPASLFIPSSKSDSCRRCFFFSTLSPKWIRRNRGWDTCDFDEGHESRVQGMRLLSGPAPELSYLGHRLATLRSKI